MFVKKCLSLNLIPFWDIQTDWQSRVLAHWLFIYQDGTHSTPGMFVSNQFWTDWLVSHREPTCLPARFSFNSWLQVKMAISHTGRLGSQSDQFSGSQETSASLSLSLSLSLSVSLSLFLCLPLSNHLFGACGRASRNGELWLVPLCSNHSLQRVSCFSLSRWQRRGKWSPTPPRLNSCTSDPGETDISRHLHCPRSSLAAHAELFFYIKMEENFTKNIIIGRSQTQSSAFTQRYVVWWLLSASALPATSIIFMHLQLQNNILIASLLPQYWWTLWALTDKLIMYKKIDLWRLC